MNGNIYAFMDHELYSEWLIYSNRTVTYDGASEGA